VVVGIIVKTRPARPPVKPGGGREERKMTGASESIESTENTEDVEPMPPEQEKSTIDDLTSLHKVAALMITLGTDACSKIFAALDDNEVEQIATAIAELRQVSTGAMESVIQEFRTRVETSDGVVQGGMSFATEVLSKTLGAGGVGEAIGRIRDSANLRPFDEFVVTPSAIELLLEMIKDEHPQTIALILAHVKDQRAAEILLLLPPRLRSEVVARIGGMKAVSPEVLGQIEETLRRKSRGRERVKAGGVKAAAEILNRIETDAEKQIMDWISDTDPDLARQISDLMFTYDDVTSITGVGMQKLLQEIDENDLLLALKASTEEMKAKFFRNMSERRREMIQKDFETMPLVRLKDVQTAQQRVLDAAKEMILSGEIEVVRHAEQDIMI